MKIFERLTDLLKANINDLIDKAEDPEKMVKQIIIDMEEQLENAVTIGSATYENALYNIKITDPYQIQLILERLLADQDPTITLMDKARSVFKKV